MDNKLDLVIGLVAGVALCLGVIFCMNLNTRVKSLEGFRVQLVQMINQPKPVVPVE